MNNYKQLKDILSNMYDEINGIDFYNYVFPNNENKDEKNVDYSKPNAIYLYRDVEDEDVKRTLRRRIMFKDTWEEDYMTYIESNPLTLCSGLSYRGRANRLENAQHMNAMIFDLDSVGVNEIKNLLLRIGKDVAPRTLPQPTFIVMSGTGLHIYYVFEKPIDLYPNIKLQLKQLKYDLTFRLWDYKGTTREKTVQYQSINQGFRMVGSVNNKYNLPMIAFKTGSRVSLDYLNSYTIDDENKVNLNQPFTPTKYTLEEAKEKFPDWYQRVIVEGNKSIKKSNIWNIKRDLYDWWIRQKDKVVGGHRYFYLMCMSIYAFKCNIPKKELKRDMEDIFQFLSEIEHSNSLTKEDLNSALEAYDRGYYNFTIDDIEKLSNIRIERNKRNYRKQDLHLRLARSNKVILKETGEMKPEGRPSKENLVREYMEKNPNDNPTEIARSLGISRTTVYKYYR